MAHAALKALLNITGMPQHCKLKSGSMFQSTRACNQQSKTTTTTIIQYLEIVGNSLNAILFNSNVLLHMNVRHNDFTGMCVCVCIMCSCIRKQKII